MNDVAKKITKFKIDKTLKDFEEQYGTYHLNDLQTNLINDNKVNFYCNNLEFNVFPDADDVCKVIMSIDYINLQTIFINYTPNEYEKKLDYLYYSAAIIYDHWLKMYIENKLNLYVDKHGLDETKTYYTNAYYILDQFMMRMSDIYDELEENYKK